VAQVVQHLPGKCEALSSNPITTKKKKKKSGKVHGFDSVRCPVPFLLVIQLKGLCSLSVAAFGHSFSWG
jgi:hypothetical protein